MTNYRIVQTYRKRFQAQYYDRQLLTNKDELGYIDVGADHNTLQGARNIIAIHKQKMERKHYVPVVVYEED